MRRVAQVCASTHVAETAQTLVAVAVALALTGVLGVLVRVVATAMVAVMIIAR